MFYFGIIFSAIFGAVLGSFAVAQVWRLRAAQFADAKKTGDEFSKEERERLKSLVGVKTKTDRSHCLNCGYQLRWFDLIPIVSWLSLGGKCRKCRQPIGKAEVLAEVGLAVVFAALFASSFLAIEQNLIFGLGRLVILLASATVATILFVYDAKWSLLPTKMLWLFNILAGIYGLTTVLQMGLTGEVLANLAISILCFPGVYLLLTLVSGGAWVGDGDWILALGLVLLLPVAPFNAMLMLFFANILGLLAIISIAIFKKEKIKRGAQIPFGPAMIVACFLVIILQPLLANFWILAI